MDHDALPPGTRFGEFEILRVLGVGGFGIVYLAQDHSLEREVALKEYMPASLAARGQGPQITVRSSSFAETYAIGLRSFVNEARLLARFDHPSLVKVYRFWEDNATAYMVMPFLQGVTLRDTRRGMAHPPDEAWIRSVITPILSALELLHREGVYHRDIAPDNILLPPDGPPVLLDFGAARRVISDRTQSLTAILKPSYAPIEQYAEMVQMRQGPWTDLYALGAVIHYLLFGAPPAPATARAVQDEADQIENRIVPGVSPRFLEAVSWMLSIRPNQRPQNGEELRAVLDGRAEIPPRGRPGITIPGAVAPAVAAAAAAAAFEPTRHVDHVVDESRLKTSYVPTHLPTAPAISPRAQGAASFNPKAEMPTARVPPSQFDVPVAAPPPAARTAPPRTTMPPPATTQPGPPSQWPSSRPATLPPPLPGQPRPATVPPPARPAQPGAASTRPAPLAAAAAAAAAPKSSKTGMVVVAGALVAVVVLAVAGWQWSSRRDAEAASAAASAAATAPSGVAATSTPAPAIATVPVPVPVPVPAAAAVAVPAPIPTPSTAPAVVAATVASSPAAAASRAAVITAPPLTLPATVATPSASRLGASAAGASVAAIGSDASRLAAERARSASAAGSDARARPPGRPVPRVDGDPATASTGNPLRPGDSTGSGNPAFGPANNSPAALAERARAAAAARDAATAMQRPVPVVEAGPSSAREACGKRVFISLAICMDEKCEEARFRSTPECIGILARKQSRENQ